MSNKPTVVKMKMHSLLPQDAKVIFDDGESERYIEAATIRIVAGKAPVIHLVEIVLPENGKPGGTRLLTCKPETFSLSFQAEVIRRRPA